MKSIPPHIAWPAGVIMLIMLSVVVSFSALYFANADGGAQLIEGYYEQASNWDTHMEQQALNEELGWNLDVKLVRQQDQVRPFQFEVLVMDASGQPIDDLEVFVRTSRPQHSGIVEEAGLSADPERPGTYQRGLQLTQSGLWDFDITLEHASQRYRTTIRKEI